FYGAAQNPFERNVLAVNGGGRIDIRLDHGAFQGETSENALGARVGQQFRIHFPVRTGGGVATHGPSRGRAFPANLEFAGKQVLQILLVHDQHDQVDTFRADLKSPASTTHR